MSKIVNSWWYTLSPDGYCIGIIKTIDEITGEVKFRIGLGTGTNQTLDEEFIRDYGDKFYPDIIK